jgi:hypothetical protein
VFRAQRGLRTPLGLAQADPAAPFEITLDGKPIPALPGQSVAAALWAAGVLSWRTTRREGRPRGAFCGIGSCFDCLATINSRANQRACLIPARPDDVVITQEGNGRGDLAV